jgi:hypothetical protein
MSIWTEDQHMQFFKLCTLSYSTEERAFTLQAFIGLRIIIFLLMDIILAVIVLGLSFSVLISERNVVFLLFISLLFYLSLRPLIIPFQQEKFVLDKIITIGSQ